MSQPYEASRIEQDAICRARMPGIESNAYWLIRGGEALAIDPHVSAQMESAFDGAKVRRVTVLLTHEHFDHISGVNWLRERYDARVLCAQRCAQRLQNPEETLAAYWELLIAGKPPEQQALARALGDSAYRTHADGSFSGEYAMTWQGLGLRLVEAPGHSPGGMLIVLNGRYAFTGDNLVNGSEAICSFPGGSKRGYLEQTAPLLRGLPDDMLVLPGHGEMAPLGALRGFCAPMTRKRR